MKKVIFYVGLLCILSGCICIIIIFWQVNLIKTELKTVKQELESMESNISLIKHTTDDLEFQVSKLNSFVSGDFGTIEEKVAGRQGLLARVRELESRVDSLELRRQFR